MKLYCKKSKANGTHHLEGDDVKNDYWYFYIVQSLRNRIHYSHAVELTSSFSYRYYVTHFSTKAWIIKNYYRCWSGSWSNMYLGYNVVNKNHQSMCIGVRYRLFFTVPTRFSPAGPSMGNTLYTFRWNRMCMYIF